MASKMNTILIIGATSGIGEGFARRFHSQGKKVVIAGRRTDRLSELAQELPGVETRKWDITDLSNLPSHVSEILGAFPSLDTVFLNAGIQKSFSLLDPSTSTATSITTEITSNLTAPILLARLFIPHLMGLAGAGKPANLLLTSSTLAFMPLSFYPVYCPTKAAIHAFCLMLRQQLNHVPETIQKNLSVVEVVPPYTDTGLDAQHRETTIELQGGKDKAFPPMPLAKYLEEAFASLNELDGNGKLKKEVGIGFGQMGVETWRGSFGKILEGMGIDC